MGLFSRKRAVTTTENDKYNFDNDDFNFDSVSSDIEQSTSPDISNTSSRNPVMKAVRGAGLAVKDQVTSPEFIKQKVLKALPPDAVYVTDAVDKIASGTRKLYDDSVKELKPSVGALTKKINKLVPQNTPFVKKLTEGVDKLFNGEQFSTVSTSKEEAENQQIESVLGGIFTAQAKAQEEIRVRQRAYDESKEQIKDTIESKRFDANIDVMTSISTNISKIESYNSTIQQAYQRKSLELQYRAYFLQVDQYRDQIRANELAKANSEAIVKNTALPEFVKIKASEKFKDTMRNKFYDNLSNSSLFTAPSDFIKEGFDKLGKKLSATITDIKSGIESSSTLLEMLQSSVESEEEMAKMGIGSSNGMTGQIAGIVISKLFDMTANLAAEHGKESLDKHKKAQDKISLAISKAKDLRSGILDFLNSEFANDLRDDNSKDGTFQKILFTEAEKLAKIFADAKTIDTTLQTKKGGVADLKEPAVFDNRTYRTINDIIPGYLSRMVFELQYANTRGFTDSPEIIKRKNQEFDKEKIEFDFKSNRFISRLDSGVRINEKISKIAENAELTYAQGAEEVAIEFLGGGTVGKMQLDELKKSPEQYRQFMLDINNSVLGNAGSNSMQGIKDSGALNTAGEKFKDIYKLRLEQFKTDRVGESKLMDSIISAKTRISIPTAQLQDLIFEYGEENVVDLLEQRKMVSRNVENNDVTFDVREHMQRLNVAAGAGSEKQLTNTHRTTNFNEVRLNKELEEIIKLLPGIITPSSKERGVMASLRRNYDHARDLREQVYRLNGEAQKKKFVDWFNSPSGLRRKRNVNLHVLTDEIDKITGTIHDLSSEKSKAAHNAKVVARQQQEATATASPAAAAVADAGLSVAPAASTTTETTTAPVTTRDTDTGDKSLNIFNDNKSLKLFIKSVLSSSAKAANKDKLSKFVTHVSSFSDKEKKELQESLSGKKDLSLSDLETIIQNIKPISDVGKKRNIRSIDYGNKFTEYNAANTSPTGNSPLNTVSSLESKIWNYNPNRSANDPNVDHVGPMAQDMQKVGGNKLAPGGTTVDLVSANGLNMAAIKEMNEKFDGAFNLLFRNLFTYNETIIGSINKTNATLNELLKKEVSVNIKEDGKTVNINEAILANIKRSNKFLAVMAHQGRVTSTASAIALNQSGVEFKDEGKGFAKSIKQIAGGTFDLATLGGSAAIKGTVTTLRVAKDNVIIPVYNNLVKLGEKLKDPLKKGLVKAGELAWDGIGKAKDITQDLVTNKVPRALGWMTDKATSLKDKVVNTIKFRTNLLNEKGEVVFYKDLLQAGQYIREDTGEVIKKLSDLKGTILVKGSNIRINAQDYLGRLYDESKKKLDIYGNKAWSYVKQGVGKAWDVASNLGEHTADFLKNTWKGDNFLGKTIHAGAGMISRALGGMGIGLGGGMGSRPIYNVLLDIRDLLRKGNRKIKMRSDIDEKNMEAKDAKHALNVEEVTQGIKDTWENQITNKEWYKNLSEEGKALAKKQYEEKLAMVKGFSAEQLEAFKNTDNEIKEGDGFFRRLVKRTRGRMVTGVNLGESLFDKTKELADKFTQPKPTIDPESKGLQQTSDIEADVKNNIGTISKEHGDKEGFHIVMFRKENDKNLWYVPPTHAVKLGAKKDMWITGSYKGILKLFKEYKALDDKKKEHQKLSGKPLNELHTVRGVKNMFQSVKDWYKNAGKTKVEESADKTNIFNNAVKTVDEELKDKIEQEAKDLKEENKKKKDGGILGKFLSHIPGLNLFGKKAAFNDKDGDGDRDGNAEDMSKQSKEIREAQKKRGLLATVFGLGKKEEKESKDEGGFFSGLFSGFGSLGVLFRAIKFIAPAAAVAATAFGSMGGALQALNPNATADEASDWKWDAAKAALGMYAGSKIMGGLFGAGKKLVGFGKATGSAGAGLFSRVSGAAGAARGALAAASGASKTAKAIGVTRALLGALTGVSLTGLATGTASIIGGIISSPITVPALVGAAVIGGAVYGYKKWKKDSDLWKVRFAQYGFVENGQDNQYFDKLHKLEQWIINNNFIQTKDETVTFTNLPTKDVLALMEINKDSDTEVNNFVSWFVNRFKPFFLNFHTLLHKNKLKNPDDVFKAEDAVMQSILRDMIYANGPYNAGISPFPTKPSCENTLEHVKDLVEYTINSLRKKKALSKFDLIDYYKLNQQSKSLEDIKNGSLNKRQQEQQSVKDRLIEKQDQAKKRLAELEFAQKYRNEYSNLTAKKGEGDEEPEQSAESVNKVVEPPEESKSRRLIGADGNPLKFINDPNHQQKGRSALVNIAGNKEEAINNLNPNVKKMLLGMAAEYNYYTNKKLTITGGFRSKAYNDSLKGAAEFSLHRLGIAIDMDSPDADKLENLGLLRKYGFTRPIRGEPWHLEPAGIQANVTGNYEDKNGKKRNEFFEKALANPNAVDNDILRSLGRGGGGLATITPKGINIGGRNKNIALGFFNSSDEKKITNSIETSTRIVNQRDQYVSDVKAKAEGMEKYSSVITGNATKPGASLISREYENNEALKLNGVQKDSLKTIDDFAKTHNLADSEKENLKSMAFIESSLGLKIPEISQKDREANRKNGRALGLMQVKASNIPVLLKTQKALLERYGIDTTLDPSKFDLFDPNTNMAFALALAKDNEDRISKQVPGVPMTPGLKYLIHQLGGPSSTALIRAISRGELDKPINKVVTDYSKLKGNLSYYTDKDGNWLTVGQVVDSANRHMSNISNKLNGRNPTTMMADTSKPAAANNMAAAQAAVFAPATPTKTASDTRTHLGVGNSTNLRMFDKDNSTPVATPTQTTTTPEQEKTAIAVPTATSLATQIVKPPKQFTNVEEIDKAIKARNTEKIAEAEVATQSGFMKMSTNQTTYSPAVSEISVVTDTLIASHSVHVDNLGVNKQILATLLKLVEVYSKPASAELEKALPKIEKENKEEVLENTPRRPQSLRDSNNPAPIKLTRVYNT